MARPKWFRRTKAAPLATANPVLIETLALLDGNAVSYGALYRKVAPVRTVVDFLADAVSTTSLKVYRRQTDGRPEAHDHPLAEVLRAPNPFLDGPSMIFRIAADLAIYGNSYLRIMPNRDKLNLIPLPVFRVTPKGGDLMAAQSYDFFPPTGAPPINIPSDQVVHFRFYDPEDPRVGSSKLEALRPILLEEIEMSKHRRGYWANGTRAEGWIEFPGDAAPLDDDGLARLRESINATHGGSSNAGKIGILEEGAKFNQAGWSARDSEFIAGREFILEASARAFNLPLPLLSLTQTATYASQVQFRTALFQDTLPPWFDKIQSTFEVQLFPWFADVSDLFVEFNVRSKLEGNFMDQAKIVLDATGRPYMTVREARRLFNMDARDDPSDDELAIPTNNVSLGEPEPVPLAPVPALAASMASDLSRFFDRQEQVTRSRRGAGQKDFDLGRWNRELAPMLGTNGVSEALAARINLTTQLELLDHDPAEVFERARRERLPLILKELP